MMCVALGMNAQSEESFDAYCMIHIYHASSFSTSCKIEVYMPDVEKIQTIQGEDGKAEKFINEAHALTYMGKKGWKYEQKLPDGWIVFSKSVRTIEETKNGIKLGSDKK